LTHLNSSCITHNLHGLGTGGTGQPACLKISFQSLRNLKIILSPTYNFCLQSQDNVAWIIEKASQNNPIDQQIIFLIINKISLKYIIMYIFFSKNILLCDLAWRFVDQSLCRRVNPTHILWTNARWTNLHCHS